MKKKLIIVGMIIAIAFYMLGIGISNAAGTTVGFESSVSEAKAGDTFKVVLSANCETGINGVSTTFSYNSNQVELQSRKINDDFQILVIEMKMK